MKPFLALMRKHLHDTRGTLLLSGADLLRPGVAVRLLHLAQRDRDPQGSVVGNSEDNRFRWLRSMGLEEQPPSVSIMMTFWSHPVHHPDHRHLGHQPGLDRRRARRSSAARWT